MVIDIKRALVSNRLMKSLTGLSAEEFLKLVPAFQAAFFETKNEKYEREKAKRQRKPGSGPKGLLASADEKLFFILLYLKILPLSRPKLRKVKVGKFFGSPTLSISSFC